MSFLVLRTEKAKVWAEGNLVTEPWQWSDNIVGIDHWYIEDIVDGMIDDGLEPEVDFTIQ